MRRPFRHANEVQEVTTLDFTRASRLWRFDVKWRQSNTSVVQGGKYSVPQHSSCSVDTRTCKVGIWAQSLNTDLPFVTKARLLMIQFNLSQRRGLLLRSKQAWASCVTVQSQWSLTQCLVELMRQPLSPTHKKQNLAIRYVIRTTLNSCSQHHFLLHLNYPRTQPNQLDPFLSVSAFSPPFPSTPPPNPTIPTLAIPSFIPISSCSKTLGIPQAFLTLSSLIK